MIDADTAAQLKPATDIVHIKSRLGTLAHMRAPLIQQTWFVALQGLPLLAWLSVLIWRKREDSLANNPRLRRHSLSQEHGNKDADGKYVVRVGGR